MPFAAMLAGVCLACDSGRQCLAREGSSLLEFRSRADTKTENPGTPRRWGVASRSRASRAWDRMCAASDALLNALAPERNGCARGRSNDSDGLRVGVRACAHECAVCPSNRRAGMTVTRWLRLGTSKGNAMVCIGRVGHSGHVA